VSVLVTGGAGFIGSHLVDRLVTAGNHVVVLDDLSTGSKANLWPHLDSGAVELAIGSTSDNDLVQHLMGDAEFCYHLASAVGVELICGRPLESLLRNVHGCENVISAAAEQEVGLVFSSTSEIYGHACARARESSPRVMGPLTHSRWGYALAKGFGEMLSFELVRSRGAAIGVVRLFNVAGPRQSSKYGMVLPTFVEQAMTGRPLTVHGDGSQTRCFCHVEDVVEALLALRDGDSLRGDVFNVGSDHAVSIHELAENVIDRTESDSEIRLVPYSELHRDGSDDPVERIPDTTAIARSLGWTAERSVTEIIDDVIGDFDRDSVRSLAGI
jgi:UDP-glucose 4-epimerase